MNVKNVCIADIYQITDYRDCGYGVCNLQCNYKQTGIFYHLKFFNKDLFFNLENNKMYKISRHKIGDKFISRRSIIHTYGYFEEEKVSKKELVKKLSPVVKDKERIKKQQVDR